MIEELRSLLKNPQSSIFFALVLSVDTAEADQCLVKVKAIPEGHDMMAMLSFPCGLNELPEPFDIAVVVLPGDASANAVVVSWLPRLQSENLIPKRAIAGQTVISSRKTKKLSISSDTRINIGKGLDAEETEPLVLGTQLKTLLNSLMTQVVTLSGEVKKIATDTKKALEAIKAGPITAPGTPAGGPATADGNTWPALALALGGPPGTPIPNLEASATAAENVGKAISDGDAALIAKYLTDAKTNILSQIAFTERGAPE